MKKKPGPVSLGEAKKSLAGLGYERIEHVPRTSYTDNSMVIIVPSREPVLHTVFVQALQGLNFHMNQKRALIFVSGAEVGKAYDEQVAAILAHPELKNWKYVLTLEDDTIPPPDAPLRLVESIEAGPFDAVGGLYFLKGGYNMPQAYGDPVEFARTGVLDFRPRDIRSALQHGEIMEVNGIAMGCSLYRMSAFRDIPAPWFVTRQDSTEGQGMGTQDLVFCSKARRAGKRFAVDMRVRCAHVDYSTMTYY